MAVIPTDAPFWVICPLPLPPLKVLSHVGAQQFHGMGMGMGGCYLSHLGQIMLSGSEHTFLL